jgi:protein gp37
MAKTTSIEWADATWNPWWGCSHVSPGCVNCYAETWAKRTGLNVWGAKGERRTFGDKHWAEPLAWNVAAKKAGERRRVFCASMADVFEDHPALPAEREKLWSLIEATPWLDWLLLTKRIENVEAMTPWQGMWPDNVWIGTSIENQEWADKRIPILLEIPAVIRFLSCEPLIGEVDLRRPGWLLPQANVCQYRGGNVETDRALADVLRAAGKHLGARYVDWVIVGGESGHGARRMDPMWARRILGQCGLAGVPVLFKQAGSVLAREWRLTDAKGGDVTELPPDFQVREWPDPLGQAALL